MEKEFAQMTAEEKKTARVNDWLAAEGVTFDSPEAEAGYKARIQRLVDAIEMKKTPDRVPVLLMSTFMPTQIYGVSSREALYDYKKLLNTHIKFMEDYRPDFYGSPAFIGSGKIYEILDTKFYDWPGHGLGDNAGYQFLEKEYMKADEYEALIEDPSNFWLRTYLPRIFGALSPLSGIGAFPDIWEIVGVSASMIPFGIPDVQNAFKALMAAGNEAMIWIQEISKYEMTVRGKGFPTYVGGASKAPYDVLADTLRGTRGMMVDIYRQPDMVLKAMERITPIFIKQGLGLANLNKNPLVFMPLHKGADGFMSDEQFKEFYWPSFKAVMLGLIEAGCIPLLFAEGGYNSRLEYLRELPKGSTFWMFDRTDMAKAKEILGGQQCIGGNIPAGTILTGTTDEIKAYCKDLIDVAGKGGGYVMGTGTALDEGNAENLHAMIDFTIEYGVYAK